MNIRKAAINLVLIILISLLFFGGICMSDVHALDYNDKEWTFYVYMVGDNMESDYGVMSKLIDNMRESAESGNIRYVVETGGVAYGGDPTFFNPNYIVISNIDETGIKITKYLQMGDMCSDTYMYDFFKQAQNDIISNSLNPDHCGIIFCSHGNGPYGWGGDQIYKSGLSLYTLQNILSVIDQHFGIVIFKSCHMQNIETAKIMAPYFDVMVGSESVIYTDGTLNIPNCLDFINLGNYIDSNIDTDALSIGNVIASRAAEIQSTFDYDTDTYYEEQYHGCDPNHNVSTSYTFSVLDLKHFRWFNFEFNKLCSNIYSTTKYLGYDYISDRCLCYRYFDSFSQNIVDIMDIIDGAPSDYDTGDLIASLKALIPYNYVGSGHDDCVGLNVYYPRLPGDWYFLNNEYDKIAVNFNYYCLCYYHINGEFPFRVKIHKKMLSNSARNYWLGG